MCVCVLYDEACVQQRQRREHIIPWTMEHWTQPEEYITHVCVCPVLLPATPIIITLHGMGIKQRKPEAARVAVVAGGRCGLVAGAEATPRPRKRLAGGSGSSTGSERRALLFFFSFLLGLRHGRPAQHEHLLQYVADEVDVSLLLRHGLDIGCPWVSLSASGSTSPGTLVAIIFILALCISGKPLAIYKKKRVGALYALPTVTGHRSVGMGVA